MPQLLNQASHETLPGFDPEERAALGLAPRRPDDEDGQANAASSTTTMLSNVKRTSDFCLWQSRTSEHGGQDDNHHSNADGTDGSSLHDLGWKSLEGNVVDADWNAEDDSQGVRGQMLKRMTRELRQPHWGQWVDVFLR